MASLRLTEGLGPRSHRAAPEKEAPMSLTRSLALVAVLTFTAAAHGATIFVDAANCPGPGIEFVT